MTKVERMTTCLCGCGRKVGPSNAEGEALETIGRETG
jgi:hypothetical protein